MASYSIKQGVRIVERFQHSGSVEHKKAEKYSRLQ